MSLSDPLAEATSGRGPEVLAEVGVYPTAADGFEHGLVILAMGQPYWLMPSERQYRLLTEEQTAEQARAQLACFDRESAVWPPQPPAEEASTPRLELATPLLWGLVVSAVFWG